MTSLQNRQEKLPTCFLICPLGDEDSQTRRRADFTLRLISRALKDQYSVSMAGELPVLGRVDDHVMRNLLEADLVAVDLSDKNPNVYFEFGIRYTLVDKPFICICRGTEIADLPFDVAREQVIPFPEDLSDYQNDYERFEHHSRTARSRLADLAQNLQGNPTAWETPLANQAIAIDTLAKASSSDKGDIMQVILGRLSDLQVAFKKAPMGQPKRRPQSDRPYQSLDPDLVIIKRLIADQRYEEALDLATTLLEQDPQNDGVAYYRGEALTALRRYEEAKEMFTIALEFNPRLTKAKRQLQLLPQERD